MPTPARALLDRRMLVVLLQGFSGGLPLALTGTTLQAWMTDRHVDIADIGLFSLVGLPYAAKFVWSPLMDRFRPPFLGRRRGWLLTTQLLLAAAIAAMGLFDPRDSITSLAAVALVVAFSSASQDIVIDAYRVETLAPNEYGVGSGLYIMGYRIAMLTSGALALGLADRFSWKTIYLAMAATMIVGVVTTLIAPEPKSETPPPKSLDEAVVQPFLQFLRRPGAIEILIFLIIYKLDTNLSTALMTTFFMGLGFAKTDIAAITKVFGMVATIGGTLAGGALMVRWTQLRALVTFGILQAVASLAFLSLAIVGKNHALLVFTIAAENFFSGMAVAAFTAFMMSLVHKSYTATQYALITSFMALSRYVAGAPAGYLQKAVGWKGYFIVCALIGLPGLLMLLRYDRWTRVEEPR